MPRTVKHPEYRYRVDNGTGCWLWTATLNTAGYGVAPTGKRGGKTLAHRLVYTFHVGAVPTGLELDHLCRFRHCVNPDHLEPVTHAENVRRGHNGRHNKVKTHCPTGHAYIGDNIKWYQGRRYCRECHRIDGRRYKAALKAPRP